MDQRLIGSACSRELCKVGNEKMGHALVNSNSFNPAAAEAAFAKSI
jgi:hypothetical protein